MRVTSRIWSKFIQTQWLNIKLETDVDIVHALAHLIILLVGWVLSHLEKLSLRIWGIHIQTDALESVFWFRTPSWGDKLVFLFDQIHLWLQFQPLEFAWRCRYLRIDTWSPEIKVIAQIIVIIIQLLVGLNHLIFIIRYLLYLRLCWDHQLRMILGQQSLLFCNGGCPFI